MKNDKIKPTAIQHDILRRSDRIYRQAIKQPISQIAPLARKIGRNMDIARSKSVAHFSPQPTPASAPTPKPKPILTKRQFDIAPVKHPLTTKVNELRSTSKPLVAQPTPAPTLKMGKEQIIAEAFSRLEGQKSADSIKTKRQFKSFNIIIIIIAILIIIGYLIFINIPVISVNIASAQAGISATYPKYYPDGYSLDGPVAYSDGTVAINFKANTGVKKFTITQSKSSWDSSAVKNKVNIDSKSNFSTTAENGLTIYTYNNNAAWVNGGILYAISGDAPLSNSQIRHIATSL